MKPTSIRRRALVGAACALALTAGLPGTVLAQAWPAKPIKLVVAFGPGSGNDLIARDLAQHMGEFLGQPVVVENRPGGGGAVGTDVVAKAAPDGYTIGLGTSSQLVMNVGLYKNLPFDVERDLRAIGLVARTSMVLVASNGVPKTLKELIAHAKANPGKVTYGSGGPGSISHIVGEAFAKAADISLLHVPYKGNGPALADLAGGHVNLLFDGFLTSAPLAQQGRASILGVSGPKRNPGYANVPTLGEQGLANYEAYTWNSLFAPARTPNEVIEKLNTALNKALVLPAIQARLAQGGSEAIGPSTPEQAEAFGKRERSQWVGFIQAMRIDMN